LQDYVSFAGFFIHYVEGLRAPSPHQYSHGMAGHPLSPIPSAYVTSLLASATDTQGMTLILAGYSYGSVITTHLPPTSTILQRFETVSKGTAEADIRLRAISLAAQWRKDARSYREAQDAQRRSHEKLRPSARTRAVAVGGDECEPGSRRPSHESRRSLDSVIRSVDRGKRKLFRQHSSEVSEETLIVESLVAANVATPRTCYLLISPVLPPISMFVTMFSSTLKGVLRGEGNLLDHPTLAVYGDRDFFTSQKKLRRWAESLKEKAGSDFQFHEISGAGHFWREEGADKEMRSSIREWVQDIGRSYPSE
jgi:pimeloyl-ACP methyl ester carboxylesterase